MRGSVFVSYVNKLVAQQRKKILTKTHVFVIDYCALLVQENIDIEIPGRSFGPGLVANILQQLLASSYCRDKPILLLGYIKHVLLFVHHSGVQVFSIGILSILYIQYFPDAHQLHFYGNKSNCTHENRETFAF